MHRTSASTRPRGRQLLLLPVVLATVALVACAPPPTPTDPSTPWLPAGCIDSDLPGVPDILFNGTANELDNSTAFFIDEQGGLSEDGSCEGDSGEYKGTIVRAATVDAAADVCTDLGLDVPVPPRLIDYGYPAPIDAWTCVNP